MEKMDKSILFTPLELAHITLPGRLVRSSTELFSSLPDGHIRSFETDVFRALGTEPLGMILTGHTCVSPEGRSNRWQNAVWDDSFIPDAAAIAEAGQAGLVPSVFG